MDLHLEFEINAQFEVPVQDQPYNGYGYICSCRIVCVQTIVFLLYSICSPFVEQQQSFLGTLFANNFKYIYIYIHCICQNSSVPSPRMF